ncbi:MAG TPA: cation transporter, partial [Propylenella sp.]|nr:cation transporter [Propylenella sp.]
LAHNVEGVVDVHHMHVWSLDGRRLLATLHARPLFGREPSTIIAAVKSRLDKVHGIGHATVEVETGRTCPDAWKREERHGTA